MKQILHNRRRNSYKVENLHQKSVQILKVKLEIKKKLQVAVEMEVNPQTQTRNEDNGIRDEDKSLNVNEKQ